MRIFLRPDQADCIVDCLQSWWTLFEDESSSLDGPSTKLARRLASAQVTEIIALIERAKPKGERRIANAATDHVDTLAAAELDKRA